MKQLRGVSFSQNEPKTLTFIHFSWDDGTSSVDYLNPIVFTSPLVRMDDVQREYVSKKELSNDYIKREDLLNFIAKENDKQTLIKAGESLYGDTL